MRSRGRGLRKADHRWRWLRGGSSLRTDATLPTTPLTATIGGKELKFQSAIVRAGNEDLTVVASTSPELTCDKTSGATEQIELHFPQSSDGSFHAGKVLPISLDITNIKDPSLTDIHHASASYARAMLAAPFSLDDATAKVSLEFDQTREVLNPAKKNVDQKGGGTIEAKMCLGDDGRKALAAVRKPPASADEAVAGAVAGKPWAVKKAFAWLHHDELVKRDVISELAFYENADATCEMGQKNIFELGGILGKTFTIDNPGLSDKQAATELEVPVEVSATELAPGSLHWTHVNSVRGTLVVSKVELKEGGVIEGRVWMDDAEGKLAGSFKATVCKRDW